MTKTFEFQPDMPDIMKAQPISAYTAGDYMMLVVRDVPSIGERMAKGELPLRFPYALAVISTQTQQPRMLITLESGITGSTFLCQFWEDGTHGNLGDGAPYLDQADFEKKAIEIACDSLSLDPRKVAKNSG